MQGTVQLAAVCPLKRAILCLDLDSQAKSCQWVNDSDLVGSLFVCHFWAVNFESFIDDRRAINLSLEWTQYHVRLWNCFAQKGLKRLVYPHAIPWQSARCTTRDVGLSVEAMIGVPQIDNKNVLG